MKWSFEDVQEAYGAMHQAFMDNEFDQETLENGLSLLWLASKWDPAEYDEEVLARNDGLGCRRAVERNANA